MTAPCVVPQQEASGLAGEPRPLEENSLTAADPSAATGNESPPASSSRSSPTLSPRLSDGRSAVSSDPNTPLVPLVALPNKHALPNEEWLSQALNRVHPIHLLPVELLGLMFQWGTLADPATFPTLVSQVSSAWRTLALTTSSLWTYINLSGSHPYDKARLWISRALPSSSASTLLRISFDISEGFDPSPDEMQEAMSFVLPYIDRWGSFSVRVHPDALQVCLETLCSLPKTLRARRLKHLRIESTEFDAEEQWDNLFNDDLPALESIWLSGVSVPWNGPLLMAGDGLKHLHIGMFEEDSPGAPSLPEFVAILTRNAGTLVSLTVDESNITHDEVEGSDPELEKELVLPNLEILQMTQLDRDVYWWMVRRLRCPKVVEYTGNPGQHDMEFNNMVQNQPRASPFPNVRRLKSQYTNVGKGYVILAKMFRMLRKLEVVEFYQCILCPAVGESFIWDPKEPRGTALKELTFVATKGLSAEVLTRIVKSRNEVESRPKGNDLDQPYPPKLEKLVLRGCPMSLAAEDIKYLKLNVERFEWSESVESHEE